MNQLPRINEEYWLNRNPNIIRSIPTKAYYGSLLIRVELDLMGASIRYHQFNMPKHLRHAGDPNYKQYLAFVKRQCISFNHREILRTEDNRYVHVRWVEQTIARNSGHKSRTQIFDAEALYKLYFLLKNKPTDVKISRQMDILRLYSNNEDSIIKIIDHLGVADSAIRLLGFPKQEQIETLLAGKEYNTRAPDFKYKVFFKQLNKDGIPALYDYLLGVADTIEVDVPKHCFEALAGCKSRWHWTMHSRSHLYAKDENTVLIIKMLAGDRFSNYIELVPMAEENDK